MPAPRPFLLARFRPTASKNLPPKNHRARPSHSFYIHDHRRNTPWKQFQPITIYNDPRIPEDVSCKTGYVNAAPKPPDFRSARLWGIAIADRRLPGHKTAQVEIAWTQLSCRIHGKEFVLNHDLGHVNGGLYIRHPWFGGHDYHQPMPSSYDEAEHATVIRVGERPDRIWHFWSASPRAMLPVGTLEGCTAKARVKISPGALLQIGFDCWRNPTVGSGSGGNNQEAGASNWYFPSSEWQEAEFTDIGGVQFCPG